ncbi:alpha/beta hydrolase [Gluconacetobacter azotocaptans]|uniref:Alpha/beta hydrolase n=2 Tax=Gluconacetobacter azotocaptans TaxID=142834 RepID=A0A7W4JPZ5_9PROT|nr:alpha/beta hydrolase [Gluconacetobacter azotocaptans]MBM9402589.1 alpha/beta hydrolase [Gluconacetobacter azotocaptans]GBQ31037.1 hypothetical protein AA13594_1942 [Gluconacetobacter azotocaptans DSM 13594]
MPPAQLHAGTTAVGHSPRLSPAKVQRLRNLLSPYDTVIVPGLHGSGPDHWQTRWQIALASRRVIQKDWAEPIYESWVTGLEKTLRTCRRPVLFIAHSLGAVLVARWAQGQGGRGIAGAFLVAPADVETSTAPERNRIHGFHPLPRTPLPFPATLVASRNDNWLAFARAEDLAAAWQASLVDAGASGHIGGTSGLGAWDAGLDRLTRFVRALPDGTCRRPTPA